ncbi:MAG: pantoate--beta-alanine ligase [Elusimicrobia bacterium]|nr:pantoate--beta-alanine ligase [Elusimicrobiota bacterium]
MKIVRYVSLMQRTSQALQRRKRTLGLVPTMGALHGGHLSLIRRARRENDRVVVSIFVNPLQFGPREDFKRYPKPLARDRSLCSRERVDFLFLPTGHEMVPPGFGSHVEVEGLSDVLCGEFRPGHFRGVATIVLKLLEIARPSRAYFGEKDFQQLTIVRRMASDFNLPVRIIGCPTVREADGLALSSRNAYLDATERAQAPLLHQALSLGARMARRGRAGVEIRRRMREALGPIRDGRIEYARIVDPTTLRETKRPRPGDRVIAAIRIGRTRLIDNVAV